MRIHTGLSCMGRRTGQAQRLQVNPARQAKEAAVWRFPWKKSHFIYIPYTPQELESALHREELPAPRRTVVSILGAMRGVGGIDSWGSDVEPAYHVPADEDIEYGFVIRREQDV